MLSARARSPFRYVVMAFGMANAFSFAAAAEPDVPEHPDLVRHGIELREQGKDQEALDEFTRAYALDPRPGTRAQIALAEQALGRWAVAETHLEEALKATTDAWILKNHVALERALETIQAHLGDLFVEGTAGAEIFVDGSASGVLPLYRAIRLEMGTHVVMARKQGNFQFERTVRISTDAPAREHIDLVEIPKSEAVTARDEPRSVQREAITSPTTSLPPPVDVGRAQRNVGWGLLIGAAPFAIVGVVGIAQRAAQVASYNASSACPGEGQPNQPAGCTSFINLAATWRDVAIVGFAGAGILTATSIIVLLTAPQKKAVPIACAPSVTTGWAIGCTGAF